MRTHTYLAVLLTASFACRPSNSSAADTSAKAKQAIDAANTVAGSKHRPRRLAAEFTANDHHAAEHGHGEW